MKRPIMKWDDTEEYKDEVIWWTRLDDRYLIETRRTGDSKADLVIFDRDRDFEEIFCEEVGLMYGAMFGPDVSDVGEWQEKAVDFVDNKYKGK
jgi:hypothetical protein